MEIVAIYVIGGLIVTYLALVAIDISDKIRYAERERQIIKSIIGRY